MSNGPGFDGITLYRTILGGAALIIAYLAMDKLDSIERAAVAVQMELREYGKKVDKQLEVLKDQQNLNTNRNEWQDFRLNKLEGRGDQEP